MNDTNDRGALSGLLQRARNRLTDREQSSEVEFAVAIASELLAMSQSLQTPEEKRQQAELDRMLQHPDDKATLVQWTDQAFRTQTPWRVADQLTHILDVQGVPRFFSPFEQALLRGFQSFGGYLPGVAVPMVKNKMRRETANVVLPAEEALLSEHLQERQREGIRMNVNFLGESLLGEAEARRRLEHYSHSLRNPNIECISVKISTIYSQISSIGRRHSVRVLCDRMEALYRTASHHVFEQAGGSTTSKFVYLDMEEYRDMRLTADVLMQTLDRDGLGDVRAGIALQAYLPDSYAILEELLAWAQARVALGRTPLTIRVVKGANLEMERVESSIGGWPQAPFTEKVDTDANFKRMLKRLFEADAVNAIRIGIASHNLFDIALAMVWADQSQAFGRIQFEMLEGMANHQRRAVFDLTHSMLLYAPACRREDFLHAIGYLIRRLDENTGPSNFLRHTFRLKSGSPEWLHLAEGFRQSMEAIDTVPRSARRTQNRSAAPVCPSVACHWSEYVNEPDTDWALAQNVTWAESILAKWKCLCDDDAVHVPLVVNGREVAWGEREEVASYDPSRPNVIACRFAVAIESDIDSAADCAKLDPSGWRQLPFADRHRVLRDAAQWMRVRRGDLIGAAVADGGKTVKEADPEVSEAIDFVEFYPLTVSRFLSIGDATSRGVEVSGRGAVVVISPWNFPIAIPCGGVAAALASGNTVVLKASSDCLLPAYLLCQCFWDAGVPREALQFVSCGTTAMASRLVNHPAIDMVILTGGTETARTILRGKFTIDLIAETGGKNATIVTSLSDREQAIKNVLQSAFGHAGQKCSATSLLLLEQEVFEDESFREMLTDATSSLRVGSAWDLSTRIGPLIRSPRGALARGLKELDNDESWLVMPEQVDDNPQLYRPGIKWQVEPGSFSHRTELFGPVLSVIPYRKLDEAIAIANATGYGLTSGLESLDDREQEGWKASIRAGNLYINRSTTGAVVLRQPFGGMGESSYGPGLKAGGPHYIVPLLRFNEQSVQRIPKVSESDVQHPLLGDMLAEAEKLVDEGILSSEALERVLFSVREIESAVAKEFAVSSDTVRLLGQDNIRRYLPVPHLRVRLRAGDSLDDCLITAATALLTKCRAVFSYDETHCNDTIDSLHRATDTWAGTIETVCETADELVDVVDGGGVDRLRFLCDRFDLSESELTNEMQLACIERFIPIVCKRVIANGYVEPLWFLQEQSVSHDYHRYGNLGRRAGEQRRKLSD